jgi:hypothetical protein
LLNHHSSLERISLFWYWWTGSRMDLRHSRRKRLDI